MLCDNAPPLLDQPVSALAVRLAAEIIARTPGIQAPPTQMHPDGDGNDNITAFAPPSPTVTKAEYGESSLYATDATAIVATDNADVDVDTNVNNTQKDDDDHNDARALLDRCMETEAKPPSAWQSFLKDYAATLPTRGPALRDAGTTEAPVYSTGTALAVVQRIIPVLDAHHLDVYAIRLRPEHATVIASPWEHVKPMAEIDCGAGDWLIEVACGRAWFDDVREGQELAGGVFSIRRAIHRHTGTVVETNGAQLGDGYRVATDSLFAFFRSGCTAPQNFVDARYGRIDRAPAALASLGWTLDASQSAHNLDHRWSIASAGDERLGVFVRAGDGTRVHVVSYRGSVFVGVQPTSICLPTAAYPPRPERDGGDYPFAVPRPPADYTGDTHSDDGDGRVDAKEADRVHGDRDHLIAQGLIDPMHMASGWPEDHLDATAVHWPYTRFEFDPDVHMDAIAEADWHRRLAARMHLVADLIRGDYGPPVDDDTLAAAVASPSGLMAHMPMICQWARGPHRVNARTCDALMEHLTSIGAARSWRIWRKDLHLRHGSRHHDPARGLYINWFVQCDFVQRRSDFAPATVRFYAHLVGLDGAAAAAAHLSSSLSTPTLSTSASSRGHVVAAYYCLTARKHMPNCDDDDDHLGWRLAWAAAEGLDEPALTAAVDAAIDAAQPAITSRFAADQPHPLVAYYRDREFALAPGLFRGILDEDALCTDVNADGRSAGAAVIHALDWIATAFDRHATLFALPADL
ncbi:hypothetical protein pqer_cds_790 [Pandoravirus quercus]|uniref:Uncharacterized protein n=1 Tax=Pandoravirus quercus TaxID=2107709 RepID=A0A2U7U9Z0_9VIRU|nr:hypothetical protein pqer_cds_790 [Pandoravirus quercus]AVK75212.1 hypothetical protein pqer_cds_790 [Pandoravirus quercus]